MHLVLPWRLNLHTKRGQDKKGVWVRGPGPVQCTNIIMINAFGDLSMDEIMHAGMAFNCTMHLLLFEKKLNFYQNELGNVENNCLII
jgi:hypothetical protein